jgi:hypothetical protein
MRCPVGFIEEADGTFTIYYTAMTNRFFQGFEGLGRVRVRVREENPPARPLVATGDTEAPRDAFAIANKYLSLQVDKASALAKVVDRRTGTVYSPMPAFELKRIGNVRLSAQENGWAIAATLAFDRIPTTIRYRLSPESPEIDVSVDIPPDTAIERVPLPVPFTALGKGFEWVLP